MKAIQVIPANAAAINAALYAVNGRATQHAYSTFAEIEQVAARAEREVNYLIPKTKSRGAKFVSTSGDKVCNAYAKKGFSRAGTRVVLEKKSAGWYLVGVSKETLYQSGGTESVVLTVEQAELAMKLFRQSFSVAVSEPHALRQQA